MLPGLTPLNAPPAGTPSRSLAVLARSRCLLSHGAFVYPEVGRVRQRQQDCSHTHVPFFTAETLRCRRGRPVLSIC